MGGHNSEGEVGNPTSFFLFFQQKFADQRQEGTIFYPFPPHCSLLSHLAVSHMGPTSLGLIFPWIKEMVAEGRRIL